jgi:hypothetical protein
VICAAMLLLGVVIGLVFGMVVESTFGSREHRR